MELVKDYWALLAGAVSVLVWLVRLESRTFANERELVRQRDQRHEDQAAATRARQETNARLDEIQRDIKALLSKGAR